MAYVVFIHTPIAKYRFWLALLILSIHMIFILYIHFKYHERAEGTELIAFKNIEKMLFF